MCLNVKLKSNNFIFLDSDNRNKNPCERWIIGIWPHSNGSVYVRTADRKELDRRK